MKQVNVFGLFGLLLGILFSQPVWAVSTVTDDVGNKLDINRPAQRIISIAPHVTELLFAAGAGDKVVGVVQFSDYPPAATKIKQVGSYTKLDLETIIALQPDLVVGWYTGNNPTELAKLKKFGIRVYLHESQQIIDIANTIEKLGRLSGTEATAMPMAQTFRQRYSKLKRQYASRSRLKGFYQVWNEPLITVSEQGLINDVLQLCGVDNVFAKLGGQFPRISVEAVLQHNPQMIIASGMDLARPEWLDDWRKWQSLQAVQANNLYFVPPSIIQRHAPRILDAASQVCEQAEQARKNLADLKKRVKPAKKP